MARSIKPEDLVTVYELARQKRCSTRAIYYAIERGEITPVRYDPILFKRGDVDNWTPRGPGRQRP